MSSVRGFSDLPAPPSGLARYVSEHPATPIAELIEPYRRHDAHLRKIYAQEPDHEALKEPLANAMPLFTDGSCDFRIQARDLAAESEEQKSKFIMPLPQEYRRANGSRATVGTFKEFQRNFNIFSESSLAELDWNNVIAGGSSVVNCLLPVPEEYNTSKRRLREFYHEKFSPASDVDSFLYGLTEEEAIVKIKQIESHVRDVLLTEVVSVRTKHAITICSQYPTRHIQIVLRIYKSISEILTGFDVDCSCAAYDGKNVYCSPRALQSYITQANHIDLSRRSPSYESRLSKYSRRGFEVYWPELDRSRIDPTIFERSLQRTLGLARLLVLERLPNTNARTSYLNQRREERGRPQINQYHRSKFSFGNVKEQYEDEIAEWVNEEEVSNYHTFTIPYGHKFGAKKIEKLCYTRDLLLNAEWNQPDDRDVALHRHPAFFGRVEDVVNDCCGYCPVPVTQDELDIAEEESKIYVSGAVSFIKDDPGRQQIGSFNPLTENDWTEMAYVGDTMLLCQAIVDGNVKDVDSWLSREGTDPNTRDYTGRTPLHLAVISSTPEIVRRLVDAGARLVARIADGRTALHLAAERGDTEIVRILMDKSIDNEAKEEEKQDQRRKAQAAARTDDHVSDAETDDTSPDDESDVEMIDGEESDADGQSIATGSFVQVGSGNNLTAESQGDADEDEDEPDFYDVDVLAWDTPCSALQLAIMAGNEEVVKLLCEEYVADILRPVKVGAHDPWDNTTWVLLGPTLALSLTGEKARSMVKTLFSLSSSSAQADTAGMTVLHRFVEANAERLVCDLLDMDKRGTTSAINHVAFPGNHDYYRVTITPLGLAASVGNRTLTIELLNHGANFQIDFDIWLKSAKNSIIQGRLSTFEENQKKFRDMTEQPLVLALQSPNPRLALDLIEYGADVNTLTKSTNTKIQSSWHNHIVGQSALDLVEDHLKKLRCYDDKPRTTEPQLAAGMDEVLAKYREDTYQHWMVLDNTTKAKKSFEISLRHLREAQARFDTIKGRAEKAAAVRDAIETLEEIEKALLSQGAKRFLELHPDRKNPDNHGFAQAAVSKAPAHYSFDFRFLGVADVTEARKAAYIALFEACWSGDLETIKKFTLGSWDDEGQEAPLKLAVFDGSSNSPFSLAFFRGHRSVARAILEIVQAQYSPLEESKMRYRLGRPEDADYYSDEDSEAESDDLDETKIHQEIVDDKFTIENVGQVSMKVKSHTLAKDFFNTLCPEIRADGTLGDTDSPIAIMIKNNDLAGLRFLLDVAEHFTSQTTEPDGNDSGFYTFPDKDFQQAIELGRIELLMEIIKRTGAGLPLEELVKNTGIEVQEKPRYYQGLTVYGRKRQDWATAGREVVRKSSGISTSPLLLAAMAGCIEAVEWFLSDAPLRLYLAFTKSKGARTDSRLKHLGQSPGGFEGAVSKWLDNGRNLVIHTAVLGKPSQKANELIKYLIDTCPSSLSTKSANLQIPLQVAVQLGRVDAVKMLLAAGGDQTVKNSASENLLHAALVHNPTVKQIRPVLELLDRELVAQMIKERTHLAKDGRTPLHLWLSHKVRGDLQGCKLKSLCDVLDFLLAISPSDARLALAMLDGAGNTALHTLIVQEAHPDIIRKVIDFHPPLLFRESAVGRTPVEVARDRFMRGVVMTRPKAEYNTQSSVATLADRSPDTFVSRAEATAGAAAKNPRPRSRVAEIWDVFSERAGHAGAEGEKRRLVGLHEANEVAKRLGEGQASSRFGFRGLVHSASSGADGQAGGEQKREPNTDIVTRNWALNPWVYPADRDRTGDAAPCSDCGMKHD